MKNKYYEIPAGNRTAKKQMKNPVFMPSMLALNDKIPGEAKEDLHDGFSL